MGPQNMCLLNQSCTWSRLAVVFLSTETAVPSWSMQKVPLCFVEFFQIDHRIIPTIFFSLTKTKSSETDPPDSSLLKLHACSAFLWSPSLSYLSLLVKLLSFLRFLIALAAQWKQYCTLALSKTEGWFVSLAKILRKYFILPAFGTIEMSWENRSVTNMCIL